MQGIEEPTRKWDRAPRMEIGTTLAMACSADTLACSTATLACSSRSAASVVAGAHLQRW